MSKWTDIGQQLRETREKKGLDLRDVAHSTRIPLATLEALEESDYSIFPSPTYARSFLAQYSEFLNVDAHDWIDAFQTGDVLSTINDHGYLQDDHDHIGHSSPRPAAIPKRRTSSRSREENSSTGGTSILQTLTVFIVTAALIAGGIYAYKKYEPMLSGITEEQSTETTSSKSNTDNADEASEKTADETPPATQSKESKTSTPAPDTSETAEQKTPAEDKATEPDTGVAATAKPEKPAVPKPRTGPPPKALVIEDEDE